MKSNASTMIHIRFKVFLNLCDGGNSLIKRFEIDADKNVVFTCNGHMHLINSSGLFIGYPISTFEQSVLYDSLGRLVSVFNGVDIFY